MYSGYNTRNIYLKSLQGIKNQWKNEFANLIWTTVGTVLQNISNFKNSDRNRLNLSTYWFLHRFLFLIRGPPRVSQYTSVVEELKRTEIAEERIAATRMGNASEKCFFNMNEAAVYSLFPANTLSI